METKKVDNPTRNLSSLSKTDILGDLIPDPKQRERDLILFDYPYVIEEKVNLD